ncbi:MAG: 3-hydroxyacyl-CoA dehydrogenase NAD-binding domain-containing protein [Pseudomonadota bacterium]
MTSEFHYEVDGDGVAIITWDIGEKGSMNVGSATGFDELEAAVDKAIADPAVKGVVLTSGKADFAAGMDLNVLAEARAEAEAEGGDPAARLFEFVMRGHKVMRKIELAGADPKTKKGGKPFAAATPGTALGLGLELMLACHKRFAADNPKAKIGLPEINVGIFPAGGGAMRVSRMLGLMGAAPILMEGKMLNPAKAKGAGLIDEVVAPDQLLAAAKAWVLSAGADEIVKPWDKKGFKYPGGAPYHPAGFPMFTGSNAMINGKTQGAYPAPKALLSAIYEGALVDIDTALRIEARWFVNLMMNPSSSAMIRSIFLNKQALEKGARRPAGVPDLSVKKVGVLGAGLMGAGIAYVSAEAGIEVVLIDRDQESAEKGLGAIAGLLDGKMKKGRLDEAGKAAVLARVTATADYARLEDCDLLVEAVFEDIALKASVTEMAETALPRDAIFASNTSTLPISELAKASGRPEQFIGIHFFSPVHRMPLVEIIKGEKTGDAAVAKALDFVRQIKKTPIVVNDARFFYANRCIIPYGNEAARMVCEGVKPALIENAAKLLGMPLGPLQLGDETALDLALRIATQTKAALGAAYPASPADEFIRVMVEEKGRLGRKSKAGYYDYDEKGKRIGLWPGLSEMFPPLAEQPDVETVQNRLMAVQVLEAVRALEEGVLTDIREGDVGAILGWGFAPWSGGPFGWIDIKGTAEFKRICDDLAARYGDRFTPPALLNEMAAKGESFYGRFGGGAEAAAA